jgi:hypothetical protein
LREHCAHGDKNAALTASQLSPPLNRRHPTSILMNHEIFFRTIFFSFGCWMAQWFCAGSVYAADAACAAMIKMTLPRPELPYRVEQEMKIDGKIEKNQAVYIEGYMHVKRGDGTWMRTQKPVDPKAVEALALDTTRECTITGVDTIGGMKMNVWTVKSVTPFEKGVSTHRTWIGAADGRAYRQLTSDMDQRIFYDNVVKPDIVEPKPRRTKG